MNDSHLDDEALSALLDGEADDDARAHLSGCSVCGDRLARLGAAAAAVKATASQAPPGVRESAIRAAMREAERVQPSTGARGSRRSRQTGRHPRRQPLATAGWLGLAAAFLALLVAVPALLGGGNSAKTTSAATSATTTGAAGIPGVAASGPNAGPGAFSAEPTTGVLHPIPATADLGAQTSQSALATALRDAMSAPTLPPQAAVGTPYSPAENALAQARDAVELCVSTAAKLSRASATLVFTAKLEWQGTAAVAYVFSVPGGRTAVVTSQATCQELVSFSL